MATKPKIISVSILWGESPEENARPTTYCFKTKAELEAFLLGISEMDGWLGYEIINKNVPKNNKIK